MNLLQGFLCMKKIKMIYIILFAFHVNVLCAAMHDDSRSLDHTALIAVSSAYHNLRNDVHGIVTAENHVRLERSNALYSYRNFHDFALPHVGIGCLSCLKEMNHACVDYCQIPGNCFIASHSCILMGVCCIKIGCCCPC